MTGRIVVATATRRGSREHNCDAARLYTDSDGTTIGAVIDGTGNTAELARLTDVIASAVVRISHRRGGLAALVTAADLLGDEYEAAAVTAQVTVDGGVHIHWIGDCRAWWWTGTELRQLTTDHTMGQLLRVSGGQAAERVAQSHDHWLRLGLAEATPVTVAEVRALDVHDPPLSPGQMVMLTSDGVHDAVDHGHLADLCREHVADPQALADSIVAAVIDDGGYRDDATVVVMGMPGDILGTEVSARHEREEHTGDRGPAPSRSI